MPEPQVTNDSISSSTANAGASVGTKPQPDLGGGGAGTGVSASQGAGSGAPLELTDDTLVNYQGKPVKYGEVSKRLQADYTRKQQALQSTNQREQAAIATERRRLEGIAAALAARQQGGQGQTAPADPFLAELGAAEYIDGKMAVKMVQALSDQGFAPIAKAIQERDQVITNLYHQVVQLSNTVKEMGGRFGTQDFDGKISRWLTEGGYPPEAADLAKELYLAYEGDDLDEEFPEIFRQRWEQIQTIIDAQRKSKVEAARRPLLVPGKGGAGSASKPIGLKGNESSKDVAEALWDAMQEAERT